MLSRAYFGVISPEGAASILGHLAVVIRHQMVKRDGLLWRMWPGRGE
jgi:cytochrome b561